MYRAIAAMVVFAGCGRIDFDPIATQVTDAPEHDEDGDGIVDRLDLCPHVVSDNGDADGDKVGDICDPNPNVARESFVVFATMQAGDVPFDPRPELVQRADAIGFAGDTLGIAIPRAITTTIRFDMGFDINALVGTAQHQVAIGVDNNAQPFYFVELNDNEPIRNFALVRYDGTYTSIAMQPHGGVHPGRGFIRFDAKLGPAGTMSFESVGGWIGELYVANGATPGYVGGTHIRVALNGLDVELRYVAIIATN